MINQGYERNYTNIVEPKYGPRRNNLENMQMTKNIEKPHLYSISKEERVDMTMYETYSIDPIGCKDADDAFSIYRESGKLFFAIHIADPTEYIKLHSELWDDIVHRTTTKYPSNREPIHMMPLQVLELSSLQGTEEGNIKNAITVLTEVNTSYEPVNEIKLMFTNVLVNKKNAVTYNHAANIADNGHESAIKNAIVTGLKISECLKKRRTNKTKGVKLNEVNMAYPVYEDGHVFLQEDSENVRLVKQMIAEFAIFANSFVGEYLKIHLNTGIFRTCAANAWLQTVYNDITGEQLLQEIITNGIRAEYMSNIESHDLVGMPEYCHFTSPIRRLSDCICHYLLKYIYCKNRRTEHVYTTMPFTEQELDNLADRCLKVTRADKKNQYLDIKFRLLQVMSNMILENKTVKIQYYITSYSGLFLNLIICQIDAFHVHMSYTLRVRGYAKEINPKEKHFITITQVNCYTNYDESTIPELDQQLLRQ